jgi:hypothetical protein
MARDGERKLDDLSRNVMSRQRGSYSTAFAVAGIVLLGLLVRLPSILSNGFISDESVYGYAAYAIGQGVTPYSQIMLPHPPIGYLLLVPAVLASQGNLLVLRLFNLTTFLTDALLAYWLFTVLRRISSSSFSPLVAFALFALYPLPFATTTPIELTLFDIPILLGTIFFVKGLRDNSVRKLALSGALLGMAVMIWFTGALYAFSLVGFLVFYRLKTSRDRFTRLIALQATGMVLGGVLAVAVVLGLIIGWDGLHNFIAQSVDLQTSLRASFTLYERLYHIALAVLQLLPMFVIASVGVYEISRRVKRGANLLILLPTWIFLMNLFLIFTVPRIVLNHYVAYLMPFLVFLASGPVERLAIIVVGVSKKMRRPVAWDLVQSSLAIILIVSAFLVFPYQSSFINSPYNVANQTIGAYVASVTPAGSAFWTSEGSIAYFAGRLIQAPNSTVWPFQTEYNDVFNASYVDADGVTQHGLGVVSPSEFISAWQSHQTKVLIIILGNGPVPYPDTFLWYGFQGTVGVSQWVSSHYYLVENVTFPGVSYHYNIWLRN